MRTDDFLSSVLKQSVFSLQNERPAQIKKWLASGVADFVYTKTKVSDTVRTGQLRRLGCLPVDELVTMEKPWPAEQFRPRITAPYSLRWAKKKDESAVVKLAQVAFQHSRFHADPALSPGQANTIKAAWAHNFFAGKRGDAMVIVATPARAVGFLLLLVKDDVLIIDLIAIDKQHRGHGLGHALIAWVLAEWKKSAVKVVRVGTQQSNTAAQALYQKAGFREVGRQLVWHWHKAE